MHDGSKNALRLHTDIVQQRRSQRPQICATIAHARNLSIDEGPDRPLSSCNEQGLPMYDAIIVGGSFAGLATAMQLRGYRVLLIDQYPIGAHQMSACGTPLATAQAVGAEAAIQEVHSVLVMHTAGREIRFALRDLFVTFDYAAFCRAMLGQTDAEVWTARVTGLEHGAVQTTRGAAQARFVVDAAGWRSLKGRSVQPPRPMQHVGYGIETELLVRLDLGSGLHFFWDKRLVRNGYGWIFPCGATTRFGVGAFEQAPNLGSLLAHFVARWGLQAGPTHGGGLAIGRGDPTAGEVFVVGDAAGRCLPVTGEGIRTAISDGIACGQALAAALRGELSAAEARARYRREACRTDNFHRRLLEMQRAIAHTPDSLIALAGRLCSHPALTNMIMRAYLIKSGWVTGVGLHV